MESKWHAIVPSAPLVPENDSSVLFNTAGMQPMVPYLMWEKHPKWTRIANSQKCVRTWDLEEVGDDTHCTFFEMLGNWSLGDYFKEESIAWSYEFLTSSEWLWLDPKRIAVTLYEWDTQVDKDTESSVIWKQAGMPEAMISYQPASENWWALWATWPCGPDTEIYYWVGDGDAPETVGSTWEDNDLAADDNWMEVWNNVFMVYNRQADGSLQSLPNKNVDTGMGFERILAAINGFDNVYETDVLKPILDRVQEIAGDNFQLRSGRIITDHIRTAVHMISDGVFPKNVDQGYILRRLIRRAIREMYGMGHEEVFVAELGKMFIDIYGEVFEGVRSREQEILQVLEKEEKAFGRTLKKWVREFEKMLKDPTLFDGKNFSCEAAFKLFDTYGFPVEMTSEMLCERGYCNVDQAGFEKCFRAHQEKSRSASAGKFKWGLADKDPMTLTLHTANHLLLAGLQKYVGDHVHQSGSNITPERLRFDFTHDAKVERDTCDQIEEWVNGIIQQGFTMTSKIMPKQQAKDQWVEGSFWEKYPDEVTVYTLTWSDWVVYSQELCGWPHVETAEWMGTFKIQKEQSSSSGVRRIKAVVK